MRIDCVNNMSRGHDEPIEFASRTDNDGATPHLEGEYIIDRIVAPPKYANALWRPTPSHLLF